MPSLTAYSCSQLPHTNLPLCTLVSIKSVCKSLRVCVGSLSSVIRTSGSGACSGRLGRPSYFVKSESANPLFRRGDCDGWEGQTNLLLNRLERFPVDPRQHVLNEQWVDFGFDLFEFGVFGVQRERCWVGFAGLAGAAEEVEGEELHFECEFLWIFSWVLFCLRSVFLCSVAAFDC